MFLWIKYDFMIDAIVFDSIRMSVGFVLLQFNERYNDKKMELNVVI